MLALFVGAAQPPSAVEAFVGADCSKSTCLYFTSSKRSTGYYYKRCDSAWRNVKRTYLRGFQTADALLAQFPRKTLRVDCSLGEPSPAAPFAYFRMKRVDLLHEYFYNDSTGTGNAYHWDFGDGMYSTDANPHHYYARPGDYVVTLTATNAYGTSSYSRLLDLGVEPEYPTGR